MGARRRARVIAIPVSDPAFVIRPPGLGAYGLEQQARSPNNLGYSLALSLQVGNLIWTAWVQRAGEYPALVYVCILVSHRRNVAMGGLQHAAKHARHLSGEGATSRKGPQAGKRAAD